MAFNDLIAQKIKDFEQQGVPQVFERDLDLGNPQEPKRDNIVNVVVGARRCGKTYRLYQEMLRLRGRGVELDRMLYFNFEDERLRPYEPSLLADVLDTFVLLVMTTFFWGASYYLTDICLADLPPMTLNAFRFIVAFVVLGLIFWKHVVHVNRITLRYSLIVGLALAGTYVAYNYGITRTSLSNAAFICALQVIFAPLLGFLFFRQRPGWKLGAALVVCTVGMALLTLNGELRPASGDLICLITPLCYAVDLLITEKAVRDPRVDPLGLGVCQLAVVGIVTLALALALGEPVHLPTSGRTWAAALFLGIFCSGVAFVIQSVQQQYTTASHVGLIFTLEPVFASMVAFVMTGEVLSLRGYIGAALMLLSLFIMEGDWSFLGRKKRV